MLNDSECQCWQINRNICLPAFVFFRRRLDATLKQIFIPVFFFKCWFLLQLGTRPRVRNTIMLRLRTVWPCSWHFKTSKFPSWRQFSRGDCPTQNHDSSALVPWVRNRDTEGDMKGQEVFWLTHPFPLTYLLQAAHFICFRVNVTDRIISVGRGEMIGEACSEVQGGVHHIRRASTSSFTTENHFFTPHIGSYRRNPTRSQLHGLDFRFDTAFLHLIKIFWIDSLLSDPSLLCSTRAGAEKGLSSTKNNPPMILCVILVSGLKLHAEMISWILNSPERWEGSAIWLVLWDRTGTFLYFDRVSENDLEVFGSIA